MLTSRGIRASLAAALVGGGLAVLPAATAQAAPLAAELVKETWTGGPNSRWAHPSPDPSGITYNSQTRKLIISDGEVEETDLSYHVYKGTNLFIANLDGSLAQTGLNTLEYSKEPTGVGFRPASGNFPERLFVSDDDQARIFEVNAGDGVYGNEGDAFTSSSVSFLNLGARNDAEDVAVDLDFTRNGNLFLVDGKGKRAFIYNPGPDKVFNGQGDFVEKTINLGGMGAGDPEGIAYNAARDTIFVLDDPSNRLYEVNLSGDLLNTVTLPFTMKSGAGLAFAPPSNGDSGVNAYIVDRGVDNNTSATNFNDGRLYEVKIPALGGGGGGGTDTTAPDTTITAAPSGTVAERSASISFTSSEAGSSFACSLNGAAFAACVSPKTYSSLSDGSYTFSVRATDAAGNVDASPDTASWTVQGGGGGGGTGALDIPVRTGADDAEERPSGSIQLASGDLNLGQEDSYLQTDGMRFTGVSVPRGATITKAYVTFTADEIKTATATLTFQGQASDNPAAFTTASKSISTRPRTAAAVTYSPAGWPTVGVKHQSADISPVLQEIVKRGDWASGDPLVLLVTGTGERAAESYEGGSAKAPVLHVEYTTP